MTLHTRQPIWAILAVVVVGAGLSFLIWLQPTAVPGCSKMGGGYNLYNPDPRFGGNPDAAPALADQVYTDARYGFSLNLPASWKSMQIDTDRGLESTGYQPDAWLSFTMPDPDRADGNTILSLRIDTCQHYPLYTDHYKSYGDSPGGHSVVGTSRGYVISVAHRDAAGLEYSAADKAAAAEIDGVLKSFKPAGK